MTSVNEPTIQLIKQYQREVETLVSSYKMKFSAYMKLLQEPAKNPETEKMELDDLDAQIKTKVKAINNLMKTLAVTEENNRAKVSENIMPLRDKLEDLNLIQADLNKLLKEKEKEYDLAGNEDASLLKTNASSFKYTLYFLITVFIVGALVYIYTVPESGNLDTFMFILAILVSGYYVYDYSITQL